MKAGLGTRVKLQRNEHTQYKNGRNTRFLCLSLFKFDYHLKLTMHSKHLKNMRTKESD